MVVVVGLVFGFELGLLEAFMGSAAHYHKKMTAKLDDFFQDMFKIDRQSMYINQCIPMLRCNSAPFLHSIAVSISIKLHHTLHSWINKANSATSHSTCSGTNALYTSTPQHPGDIWLRVGSP